MRVCVCVCVGVLDLEAGFGYFLFRGQRFLRTKRLLGGSGDLVSKVISTLIGVISNYKYSYLIYNPSYYKSHDPLSGEGNHGFRV